MTRIPLILAAAFAGTAAIAAVEDADGDGMISFAEVIAAYPAVTEETFTELDTDGDGMLTPEEVAAAEAAGLLPQGG